MSMNISAMEPLLPTGHHPQLEDSALSLVAKSNKLAGTLAPEVRKGIGDLVRSMNCYYSNLIEGHNTHPRDIDNALADDYSTNPEKRNLQLEARAHIDLQKKIDSGVGPATQPVSKSYLLWLHDEFCRNLPEELLWIENPITGRKVKVIPGEFRQVDVQVGRHIPPTIDSLVSFMNRFEEAYNTEKLSQLQSLIAVAASHHRLLWIHPFSDCNGRVARLMSHAMLLKLDVGSSIWSVARGLARHSAVYKAKLMAADAVRLNDYDGRGNLSETRLVEFCQFFLDTCVDQVEFMESILTPTELLRRINLYCQDEIHAKRMLPRSESLLREALLLGQFTRGKAAEITGYKERKAREVLASLLEKKLLVSDSPKGPVKLGFPLDVVERWFPALYPVSNN